MASVDTITERNLSPPKHQAPVPPLPTSVQQPIATPASSELGAQASNIVTSRVPLLHSSTVTVPSQAKGEVDCVPHVYYLQS